MTTTPIPKPVVYVWQLNYMTSNGIAKTELFHTRADAIEYLANKLLPGGFRVTVELSRKEIA